MTLDQTLPFLIFSLVAAITPGPSNVMITATGSAAGIVRGLPCVVGAAAGMAALLFTAALGLGQLIIGHPEILRVMNWCGAAFLLWLAWKIANAGGAGEAGATQPVGFFGAAFFSGSTRRAGWWPLVLPGLICGRMRAASYCRPCPCTVPCWGC